MNRFRKIALLLVLLAAAFVAGTHAQPATAGMTNAALPVVGSQTVETAEPLVTQIAPTLFHIGPLPVTNSMVCTWIVAALIILIVRLTTWKMKEVPGTGQNVMEALIEGWESLMGNVL